MKLWEENMAIPEKEQKRIDEQRKNDIVRSNSFYMRGKGRPRTNYLGSPENRRAAGISIREN